MIVSLTYVMFTEKIPDSYLNFWNLSLLSTPGKNEPGMFYAVSATILPGKITRINSAMV
jgi:hypothetical protein